MRLLHVFWKSLGHLRLLKKKKEILVKKGNQQLDFGTKVPIESEKTKLEIGANSSSIYPTHSNLP